MGLLLRASLDELTQAGEFTDSVRDNLDGANEGIVRVSLCAFKAEKFLLFAIDSCRIGLGALGLTSLISCASTDLITISKSKFNTIRSRVGAKESYISNLSRKCTFIAVGIDQAMSRTINLTTTTSVSRLEANNCTAR